ncbi:unnamed protein product [Caenorhabditis auriculariae]|uniref:L-Fucosyltransferase n=1 Tax=Caenorhabditis auriculariae TaxID=2777116 RepID=A0A8S1HLB6_9PELO|nr:unnamed protein product [Caenorhabditis auriculariae]
MAEVNKHKYFLIFLACLVLFLYVHFMSLPTQISRDCLTSATQEALPRENEKILTLEIPYPSGVGNNIFALASLIGIARLLGRVPAIPVFPKMDDMIDKKIKPIFPNINRLFKRIPQEKMKDNVRTVKFNAVCCIYNDFWRLTNESASHLHLNGLFFQVHKYFDHIKPLIMQQAVPEKEVLEKAEGILPQNSKNNYIVCAHTRRGDFIGANFAYSETKPSLEIIAKAVNDVSLNRKLTIVAMGADQKWLKNLFNGSTSVGDHEVIISKNSPSVELAFAWTRCDSVVLTAPHSTFGFWMGYLSKGQRVYYYDITQTTDSVYTEKRLNAADYFPESWKSVRYTDGLIHPVDKITKKPKKAKS